MTSATAPRRSIRMGALPTKRGRPRHLSDVEALSERVAGANTAEFLRDSAQ
jgi:hypothetical protein